MSCRILLEGIIVPYIRLETLFFIGKERKALESIAILN